MSQPMNAASKTIDQADLPTWDLSDLYEGRDSRTLADDLQRCRTEAEQFAARYRGTLDKLDGAGLAAAIGDYERLDERMGRILSFAQLLRAQDRNDGEIARFNQSISETITDISSNILFFTLELNTLDQAVLDEQLRHSGCARYRPWIERTRSFRPHQLDEKQELLSHDLHLTGRYAWMRLFDETISRLQIPFRDRSCGTTEILNLLVDRDAEIRRDAGQALGRTLTKEAKTFALITNTLAKDKEIEDRWRRFERPISSRNLANQVEDNVVDALVEAVTSHYGSLSHRYYALKARWFGMDQLNWWDRNAPLPAAPDRKLSWAEAQTTVLDAYHRFSPELASVGRQFFDNRWIDAPIRDGKAPGAFAHPTVPSVHPYLLVNYEGKLRDVMTLAHELGHGVHQVLAGGAQGHLLSDTPLTLAETASVFGEMLTFQALLAAETDPAQRRFMLAAKVEDMLNTVVRQIALHEFEAAVHKERASGEIAVERLGEIWLEIQRRSLGPALRLDEDYAHFWAYIPHFIHSPFYVYAYAFGDCLVNSLYAVYLEAESGFSERYLDMLRAGGSRRHKELLAPFGLDAADPQFWARGLSLLSGFIDQLEAETLSTQAR